MKKLLPMLSITLIILGICIINYVAEAKDIVYIPIEKEVASKIVFKPVYIKEIPYTEVKVTVTAYCKERYLHICNNGDYDNTATGTVPTVGRTIAVDPNMIPYGTQVEIDGKIYFAEDTGGSIVDNRIDILMETHQEALNFGVQEKIIRVYDNND